MLVHHSVCWMICQSMLDKRSAVPVHLSVPGFPVESSTLSEKRCLCVSFECRWMHMNREGREWGGGERERFRKEYYLLIFVSEWTSGDWCAHLCVCVCVCVCLCVRARARARVCVCM